MKRKQITILATIISLFIAPTLLSAYDFMEDGLYYNIISSTDMTVEVTYKHRNGYQFNNDANGDIVIPSSVSHSGMAYNVIRIGDYAFIGCTNLTSITIPNSVTSIGVCAFADCYNLINANISNNVTTIEDAAFNGDHKLTDLILPNSLKSIGEEAFYSCIGLNRITIPQTVTTISKRAFWGCSNLKTICNCSSSFFYFIKGSSSYGCASYYADYVYNGCYIEDDFVFVNSSGKKDLCGYIGTETELVLPKADNISEGAFYNYKGATTITIPEGVSTIGSSAFYGCTNLTSIEISNSVTDIEKNSFNGCSKLKNITIPCLVDCIGESAFHNCNSLTTIYNYSSLQFSKGSESFGHIAFYASYVYNKCQNIEDYIVTEIDEKKYICGYFGSNQELTIPNVEGICDKVFEGCSFLKSITIPNGINTIGNDIFNGCFNLVAIKFEDGNTPLSLGYQSGISDNSNYGLFKDCPLEKIHLGRDLVYANAPFSNQKKLKSVSIGDLVSSIGSSAFWGCSELTDISISNSVTNIGKSAFYGCSSLHYIDIPNDVSDIEEKTFYYCDNLHFLTIGSGVKHISSNAFNSKPTKVIWLTNTPPEGHTNAEGLINYVSNNLFSNLSNVKIYPYLSSIFEVDGIKYVPVNPSSRTCDAISCTYKVSDSLLNITKTVSYRNIVMTVCNVNKYFAYKNSFITKLEVSTDASIEENAFFQSNSLREAILHNTGNIGPSAFSECSSLETCIIGDEVTEIGSESFKSCLSLSTVSIGKNISSIGNSAFPDCKKLEEIVIPDATINIGNNCFQRCISLKRACIGNSVTALPVCVFSECTNIEKVTIGNNVKIINQYAFENCNKLSNITIPSNVETIGNKAFSGCALLANVVIADRKTALSLGSNGSSPLFADCSLDSVYIGGKITYKTLSNYGYSPFYRNTTLRSIVITDEETQIYDNEFYGCTGLKNVKIGDGVQKIGDYAFSGCSSLDYFGFGEGMQSIGKEAFSDCSSLTRLYSEAAVPPTCGSQALEDINKWNCILYVPKSNITAYQSANQWKDFFFIEENVEYSNGIECLTADDYATTLMHNLQGQKVASPTKGKIYIQNGKKFLMK